VTMIVKVAHVRLCHSRMLFVRAYPRETQEMVFDAHDRSFAFFKGACRRGIYDTMKTAVETVFVGKDRLYNRRFLQMCSHYLIDPVACTPASGWEKGQVENQVGLVRERFFTPRLRFKSYDELNAWLLDPCIAYAKAHHHPELTDHAIWEVFEAERAQLVPYTGRFDGFHTVPASVSKTCLVRFDNNKYSVAAGAVGRPVEVHAYADRIVIRQDGRIVGEHRRSFGRGETIYDPWHYVPVLARKPVPYATVHPSRMGCCRPQWSTCGASSPAPTMAIGRWWTFSRQCSPTGCRRSRPPAPKLSPRARRRHPQHSGAAARSDHSHQDFHPGRPAAAA
jgi:Mu transposase-like protein